MPRFHAGWSIGTFAGAALGVPMTALGVPLVLHLAAVALLVALAAGRRGRGASCRRVPRTRTPAAAVACSAWREPRTLAIGLMVLAFALHRGRGQRLAGARH